MGDSAQDVGNHSAGNGALTSESSKEGTLQFVGSRIFEDVTGAASLHHPEEVVT